MIFYIKKRYQSSLKSKFLSLLGVVIFLTSTVTFAEGDFYSDSYGKVSAIITKITQTQNGGFVHQSGGGYQFNPYFGIEGSYTEYPDVPLLSSEIKNGNMIHVAAKGTVPLSGGLKLYGKAGAARVTNAFVNGLDYNAATSAGTDNNAELLPYVGTGVQYSMSQNVDFNLQFAETPKGNQTPMMYSTMTGISFKF